MKSRPIFPCTKNYRQSHTRSSSMGTNPLGASSLINSPWKRRRTSDQLNLVMRSSVCVWIPRWTWTCAAQSVPCGFLRRACYGSRQRFFPDKLGKRHAVPRPGRPATGRCKSQLLHHADGTGSSCKPLTSRTVASRENFATEDKNAASQTTPEVAFACTYSDVWRPNPSILRNLGLIRSHEPS